jgi:molybdopterin molybdotransferase
MDGYAIRASDTREGEVRLVLNEVIGAGQVGSVVVSAGTSSAIMTGAPVPDGADAVIMVERTDGNQVGHVVVRGVSRPGDHIRPRAQDIARGSVVARRGQRLTPGRLGLLASLGMAEVPVVRRPVVAILSTGDEIVQPGQPLGPGQIYSSNNVCLAGLVLEAGGIPRDLGNAPDNLDATLAHLEHALDADVVLTTGGVSVGEFDFVKEAYARLGVAMDFWKVRMKPGKPLAFGRVERGGRQVPLFGLPGNPVSCMVNFLQYVRPWMLTASGVPTPFLPVVEAIAGERLGDRPGRARLIRVVLEQTDAGLVCRSTGTQSSGALSSMAAAHGLALLAPDVEAVEAGGIIRVQLIERSFMDGASASYGW